MRAAIVSAEVAPFARVGGLSDVVGALPKELAALGHDVSVFLPRYRQVDAEHWGLEPVEGARRLHVPVGERSETVALYRASMPDARDVTVYFVEHPGAFDREGIYIDPDTGHGYTDEPERFALLSRAVLEGLLAIGPAPDVLHLNDHHTAFAAVYLREQYRETPLSRAGIVFSIHNLGYQGSFDESLLCRLGLEGEHVRARALARDGAASALRLGIEYADQVNTVSERYAQEISTDPEYGGDLTELLARKREAGRLTGILNGVDYSVWDPRTDPLITTNYWPGHMAGKVDCRDALVARCGLDEDEGPIVGMVSRLADQKGFDLVRDAAASMVSLGLRLVVLGTGQQEHETFLTRLSERYPGRVSVTLAFDNELAHWIEAGSDMFLMPSRYEPCGLNQMYSLRYGTVPVVRETGGLADTVTDSDASGDRGVGFVFRPYEAGAMLDALARAARTHGDVALWNRIVLRGMAQDHSWASSAARYAELYERAASGGARPV